MKITCSLEGIRVILAWLGWVDCLMGKKLAGLLDDQTQRLVVNEAKYSWHLVPEFLLRGFWQT